MSEHMAYVAIVSGCGCCEAASVDEPQYPKSNAKDVAQWIRAGYTVERRSVEWVRENLRRCPHKEDRIKQTELAF